MSIQRSPQRITDANELALGPGPIDLLKSVELNAQQRMLLDEFIQEDK